MWIIYISAYALSFEAPPRWDVYDSFGSEARYLKLRNGGVGLRALLDTFDELSTITRLSSLYMMLHGVNLFFLLARFITLCDFQPRLGILSRTLVAATSDISHYVMVRA